jgi:transketolase
MNVEPLDQKFRAFGWHVIPVDGHDLEALLAAFREAEETKGKPTVVLARCVKGKGISFMENTCTWHGKAPNEQELDAALEELDQAWGRLLLTEEREENP